MSSTQDGIINFPHIQSSEDSLDRLLDRRRVRIANRDHFMTRLRETNEEIVQLQQEEIPLKEEFDRFLTTVPSQYPLLEDILTQSMSYVVSLLPTAQEAIKRAASFQRRIEQVNKQIQDLSKQIARYRSSYPINLTEVKNALVKSGHYVPDTLQAHSDGISFVLSGLLMEPFDVRSNPQWGVYLGPILLPDIKVFINGKKGSVELSPADPDRRFIPVTEYCGAAAHPHTLREDAACLGEFGTIFITSLLDQDLISAIYLVISFIKTCHGMDSAGKYWPLWAAQNCPEYLEWLSSNDGVNSARNLHHYFDDTGKTLIPDPNNIGHYIVQEPLTEQNQEQERENEGTSRVYFTGLSMPERNSLIIDSLISDDNSNEGN